MRDGTQLIPIEETMFKDKSMELTADGMWFTRDSEAVTITLQETKRYGNDVCCASSA